MFLFNQKMNKKVKGKFFKKNSLNKMQSLLLKLIKLEL